MPYAEDKVKKYVESHMAKFQTRVRVLQMLHLRCLTETARQQIAACEERRGNNLAFWEFFQQLSAREGWVEQFIEALEENNLTDLAREIRQVYEMHQLSSSGRKAAVSATPRATENRSQLPGPSALNHTPSPPALPPRENMPYSSEARPASPLFADIPRAAPSTTNPGLVDLYDNAAPIQETQLPVQGSKTVVIHKVASNVGEPSSPPEKTTGPPCKAGGQKPTDAQTPLATSPSLPAHPAELPTLEANASSSPEVSLRPDASSLTRQWDVRPKSRAVCVANGCFGNRKSMASNSASSALIGAPVAGTSGNQPEENCYFSRDFSPLGPSGQGERQEEQETPALRRDRKEETLSNRAGEDSRPLLLQPGFDCQGQEGVLSPKDNRGNVAVGGMAKDDPGSRRSGNLRTGDNEDRCRHHVPASSAVELSPRVGELGTSFCDPPQLGILPVSQVTCPAVFRPPPSDFMSVASTDVIPPNTPAGLSDSPSDFDSWVPKLPIQEKKLPFAEPTSTNPHRPMRENVVWPYPSAAVDQNTANRRRNTDDRVFHSNCKDDSLLKPGVLQSHPDELPVGLLGQHLSSPETIPEYSGTSDRLLLSSGSDSLQLSTLSQSDHSGEKHLNPEGGSFSGRNGGHDASHQPSNGSHQDNESIRAFDLHVREDASNDLTEAPRVIGLGGLSNNKSPVNFPGAGTGHQPDSQPMEKGWTPKPSTVFLLFGVALAVALVFFKRRKP